MNRLEIPEGNIRRLSRSFHLIHDISKDLSLLVISKTRRIFLFEIYFFPGFFERSPSDRWTAPTMTINELHNISWFSVITLIVVHQDITVGITVTHMHSRKMYASRSPDADWLVVRSPAGATRHACVLPSTCLSLSCLYYLRGTLLAVLKPPPSFAIV